MTLYILFKYLHYLFMFSMVSSVVAQHLMHKDRMRRAEITRISRIDAVYGISALMILAIGLILWFGVGKPAAFYSGNWVFHLKITLFLLAGLASIIPTRFFLKSRKGNPEEVVRVPKRVIMTIRMELLIFFIIPLLAILMAQGIQ